MTTEVVIVMTSVMTVVMLTIIMTIKTKTVIMITAAAVDDSR